MFIALRDLRRSWSRFLLVGLVVVLVALLTTVLGALANGLVSDGISGLRALPFDHMAFEHGSKATFSRSTVTDETLAVYREIPGVQATPLGVSFANAKSDSAKPDLDVALFGVEGDSFLVSDADAGTEGRSDAQAALAGSPGLVLSGELESDGIEVGDRYTFTSSGMTLPIVGFTFAGSYGHASIAYTSLETWQALTYGDDARGRFSAIALQVPGSAQDAVDEAASSTGTEIKSKSETYDGSPGFTAEQSTMTLIRAFLLVISALVVGAFFTVLIVQRTRQIGLLKAMGASSWYVIRDGLAQMVIVVALATIIGSAVGAGLVALMSGGAAPVELVPSTVISGIVLLIVAGVVGSLVPLKRITGIEPAIALGASDT
ncbi:MAG TPA: ABC transporter permease [Acidimicrobiales bacterium]|nr:ABC transporter permease [Acidimicrobiales bacterium]